LLGPIIRHNSLARREHCRACFHSPVLRAERLSPRR
jgi:hypothetical protein